MPRETPHDATDLSPAATLVYGTDSPNQVVDLYVPAGSGPWPLVLGIHGGAFRAGTRNWELPNVPALIGQGFAVATVEYRLSGEALFPAGVKDVKQATAYLRAHAAELNLDPAFFAAWGRSAGGYLAAMLGVTSGQATEFDGPDGGDSSVQAVVDWYGPSDFLLMDAHIAAAPPVSDVAPQIHDAPDSPESAWIGGPIQDLPESTARANPITYVTDATVPLPPFFLAAGTNDDLVPHQQTLILADALRAHGTQVELHILRNARHADQRFETELKQPAIEWLEQLRKAP